jgi:RNA polymerase sigma-70 factor (ECF subfamily)
VSEGLAELLQRHRRELHVRCYRRLASFDEAEDAVRETFLSRSRRSAPPPSARWAFRRRTEPSPAPAA